MRKKLVRRLIHSMAVPSTRIELYGDLLYMCVWTLTRHVGPVPISRFPVRRTWQTKMFRHDTFDAVNDVAASQRHDVKLRLCLLKQAVVSTRLAGYSYAGL